METITFADFALLGIGTIAIAMVTGGFLSWVLLYLKGKDD